MHYRQALLFRQVAAEVRQGLPAFTVFAGRWLRKDALPAPAFSKAGPAFLNRGRGEMANASAVRL